MSEIILHSPIGKEASFDPDITPISTPRGGKLPFYLTATYRFYLSGIT